MRMNKTSRASVLSLVIGVIIFFTAHINVFPRIYHNGSGSGFECDGEIAGANNPIETLIIKGAGYYLQGNTHIQMLLNSVELKDLNGIAPLGFSQLVNPALENITLARETFQQLIETAEYTPYNPVISKKLKNFAYEKFRKDNGLNPVIFKELEIYLSRGDITGTFKRTYTNIREIEMLLVSIKDELSLDHMPGMPVFRQLNELCADTTLFGSYAARVFREINKTKSK